MAKLAAAIVALACGVAIVMWARSNWSFILLITQERIVREEVRHSKAR